MQIRIDDRDHSIYLVGEENIEVSDHVLEKYTPEGKYFVSRTNIDGIFKYGFTEHRTNYTWSSRAGVMNKVFDIALIEVFYKKEGSYCYTSCATDLAHLHSLLKDTEYEIVWEPTVDSTDVVYRISKTA